MPFYQARMTLKMTTNIGADEVQNSLYFSGSNAGTDVVAIETLMNDFYDDLVALYPADVAQNNHELDIYNLDLPSPNYPIYSAFYDFPSAPSGSALPHELAVCMSFQAPRQSGIPQARRRGRIYLGPLKTSAVVAGGYVGSGVYNIIDTAGTNLLAAAGASAVVWGVYSRVDGDIYAVTNGWVDDAFDVQRRRGTDPSVRVTF